MTDEHCTDCCCARCWKALGITEYTGKPIPEHIETLRAQVAELQRSLVKYGRHHETCGNNVAYGECGCGYSAALHQQKIRERESD